MLTAPSHRWMRFALLGISVLLAALGCAHKPAGNGSVSRAPIELVETRPVETALGNPELRQPVEVWTEMFRGARSTIDLEHFYCSDWPNEPLRPVIDELGRAAARGVKVRFILDRRFQETYPMPADSLARLPNVTLRYIDMGKIAGGVQHSKYMIVDRRQICVGSQNFDWRALKHIHELGVRVDDARVAEVFGATFDLDWAASDTSGRPFGRDTVAALRRTLTGAASAPPPFRIALARGDTALVWAGYSPRGWLPDSSRWELPALVRLLDSAHREIGIQTLNYSPEARGGRDTTLDAALRRAAARGVKVKLLVSDWNTGRAPVAAMRSLAEAGVEVKISTLPQWSGGYIPFARVEHCKYAVVDGERVWVGTGNWEPGYFTGSRNLSVILDHPRFGGQAKKIFDTSWTAPSAAPLQMEGDYPPKVRGEDPPPGVAKYGG